MTRKTSTYILHNAPPETLILNTRNVVRKTPRPLDILGELPLGFLHGTHDGFFRLSHDCLPAGQRPACRGSWRNPAPGRSLTVRGEALCPKSNTSPTAKRIAAKPKGVKGGPFPKSLSPLVTLRNRPPSDDSWVHEIKFDAEEPTLSSPGRMLAPLKPRNATKDRSWPRTAMPPLVLFPALFGLARNIPLHAVTELPESEPREPQRVAISTRPGQMPWHATRQLRSNA
jgi:hypothetical protein